MRIFIAAAAILMFASALFVGAGSASAHGVSPAQLSRAGWTCFDVPGLGVHCQSPGAGASSATISFLYFFDTSDPNDPDAELTGTELLISTDLYHGQPCPQQGLDDYIDLSGGGLPYFACHHR